MYGLIFDLNEQRLKEHYGNSVKAAEAEISQKLEEISYALYQGNFYISSDAKANLCTVYQAINMLAKIDWFKKSVNEIKVFKIEDWSDFTKIIKS